MVNEKLTEGNLTTKGLTLTILFEGQSLNYDEGFGNLSVLKKLNRGTGRAFSYMSRQALRYTIVNQGIKEKGWNWSKVKKGKSEGGKGAVTQLQDPIDISEESDLFGYMRTGVSISEEIPEDKEITEKVLKDAAKDEETQDIVSEDWIKTTLGETKKIKLLELKQKMGEDQSITQEQRDKFLERIKNELGEKTATIVRTTPVKLTPAIALEPFSGNTEMLTNKFQADKIQETPNIANIEHQRSIYRYTICVDLHRIGTEADEIGTRLNPEGTLKPEDHAFIHYKEKLRKTQISKEDKAKRVCSTLDIIQDLYRDIRGRREDLKPIFVIGGVYNTCNPYFENLVNVEWDAGKPIVVEDPIE
ncbi:MAG: type I-B CRISPR-associated protein Cas7/Cst2/DevR, partial [Firmicutes bacterium HGW-Firmicutes-13]